MKEVLHKTGSLMMALLVLFSTMSFSVQTHFCGSILVDKAVFSEADTCGMESGGAVASEMENMEDNCCEEQKLLVEGQEDLRLSYSDLDFQQQAFITSFTYTFINLFEGLPEQVVPFGNYSPPLLVADIQLLDQTFLI